MRKPPEGSTPITYWPEDAPETWAGRHPVLAPILASVGTMLLLVVGIVAITILITLAGTIFPEWGEMIFRD